MKAYALFAIFLSLTTGANAFADEKINCKGLARIHGHDKTVFELDLSRAASGNLLLSNVRGSDLFGVGLNGKNVGPEVMLYDDRLDKIEFPKEIHTVDKVSTVSVFNMDQAQVVVRISEQSKNGLDGTFMLADRRMNLSGDGLVRCEASTAKK